MQEEAICAYHAMRAACPEMVEKPLVGSRQKFFTASTVRETALPIHDRGRYPLDDLEGPEQYPHPIDGPERYCFYKWSVPPSKVPVQFLPPPIHATPQRLTHLPHPSFFYEWRNSEAGAAFFRLAAARQAEELAAYDLKPTPIPKTEVPFSAPARPAAGGKRAVSRPTVPGAPPRKKVRRTVQSESDEPSGAEEEAVTQAHSEGMLPILLADLGCGGHRLELELHTSPHAAQDTHWAGSSRWQKAEARPEVVMQCAMMECPLWARAGIHHEGTRLERNLAPETFLALASIPPVDPKEYWASYERLIVRLLAWIQNTDPGTPEISDIAQAVRALSEPRGHRIIGRARTCRANPVETQHLAPDPHGGSFPPPTDVVQVIRNGLRDAASPCLTVARLLGAFTTPVDSLTANWLAFAEYNGGVYPGLAGEAVTIDRRARGPALHHNHGYEPLQESVLHMLCHVATGMPLPGDALSRGAASSSTDPLQQTGSSAGSAAEFEIEVLSSGQEQSGVDSDGGSLARRIDPLAHVGGARLVSLRQLLHRLKAVPAVSGPALEGFQPAMAFASWKHGTSIPQLLTLGKPVLNRCRHRRGRRRRCGVRRRHLERRGGGGGGAGPPEVRPRTARRLRWGRDGRRPRSRWTDHVSLPARNSRG